MNHTHNSIVTLLIGIAALTITGCSGGTDAANADEGTHTTATQVALNEEQIKAAGISTGPQEHRNLRNTLKVNGRLMLPPQNSAQVGALLGGVVARIPVEEGQAVARGQVLMEVSSPDFVQMQQDFLESSALAQLKENDAERQAALQADKINSERVVQETDAALLAAQARKEGLRTKLLLLGCDPSKLSAQSIRSTYTLVAPIAGNVQRINVTMGQFVEVNKPLFVVNDNTALHLDLTVFEEDVAKVHEGQKVSFAIANDPHGAHDAVIFGVNKAFEPGQQAIIVHAHMDNTEDKLLPGMFIDARIQVALDSALCVPDRAIVSIGDEHYIYAQRSPGIFDQIHVRTGASDQGYTEIMPLDALVPTEAVVIDGAYYLLSQLTKGDGEHHD